MSNCAKTFINWSGGILNSFDYNFSISFTEGYHNKIKVLKRNAFGYRNFDRFRNRISIFLVIKKKQRLLDTIAIP